MLRIWPFDKSHVFQVHKNEGCVSQSACDKTCPWVPVLGKFSFSISWCLGKLLLNYNKSLNHCMESLAPLRGLSRLLKNRPRTEPDGSRLLALFNALPPTDGSPFALLPPLPFQASTMEPFCSVAGNNLLLPSCSEVTFCP